MNFDSILLVNKSYVFRRNQGTIFICHGMGCGVLALLNTNMYYYYMWIQNACQLHTKTTYIHTYNTFPLRKRARTLYIPSAKWHLVVHRCIERRMSIIVHTGPVKKEKKGELYSFGPSHTLVQNTHLCVALHWLYRLGILWYHNHSTPLFTHHTRHNRLIQHIRLSWEVSNCPQACFRHPSKTLRSLSARAFRIGRINLSPNRLPSIPRLISFKLWLDLKQSLIASPSRPPLKSQFKRLKALCGLFGRA